MNNEQNLNNTRNQQLNIAGVMCCVCGTELTAKENEENSTYDIKERMCDKCFDDELRMGEMVMY